MFIPLSMLFFLDLNECDLIESKCTDDKYCVNTLGSYNCAGCHKSCNGCTAGGATECVTCADGFYQTDQLCTGMY